MTRAVTVAILAACLPTSASDAAPRDLKIGVIAKSSSNLVFLPARRGAEDAAQALSQKLGVRIGVAWLTQDREDAALQAATVRGAVRRTAARHPGIEIVEVVHHVETPQEATAAVLKTDAARPALAGWAMVGGWPLFRSSQSPALAEDLKRRGLKVVAVDALPEQLSYVERDLVRVSRENLGSWSRQLKGWGFAGIPDEYLRRE